MESLFRSANLQDKKARYTDQPTFLQYLSILAKLYSKDTYRSSEAIIWGIDPTRIDQVVNLHNENMATEQIHFLADTDFFSAGTSMLKYMYDRGNSLDEVIDFMHVLVVYLRLNHDASEEEIKQTYIYWRLLLLAYDASKEASTKEYEHFYNEGLKDLLTFRDIPDPSTNKLIGSNKLLELAQRMFAGFSEPGINQFVEDFKTIIVDGESTGESLSETLANALKPVCDVFIHPAEIEAQLKSIPPMMAVLMSTMSEGHPDQVIEVAARLHNAIIAAHPYENDNGKIAQKAANDFCKLYGITKTIFEKSIEYDQAVRNDFASAPQRVSATSVSFSNLADHGKSQYHYAVSSTGLPLNESNLASALENRLLVVKPNGL